MKRVYFLVATGLLALLFLISMWQDTDREWTRTQRRFFKTLAKDERRGLTGGIKQTIVSNLRRVDRCTTCHLAIDKPQLALAEEPFTAHPGDYLQWHPIDKFGCTVCHGGQGLATESAAAHGDVKHWEEPLLRGPLVQASCRQCHGDLPAIQAQAPLLVKGRELFKAQGCYGCHTVHEFGQTVSSDLSEIGSKSYLLLHADFEMMPEPHDRIHWFMRKLKHPRMLNPGVRPEELPAGEEEVFPTTMPDFGLAEDQIQALTVYLLSLTAHDFPASYVTPAKPEREPSYALDVERGKAVFAKFGCTACHGIEGAGGRRNWNAGLGQEVPSLMYAKAYYGNDVDRLKDLIRHGRQPVPRADAQAPQPGLYMPPWKDRISEEELDALVAYLFSLADRLPAVPPGAAQADLPQPSATVEESATSAN
ncbi:MAG: c-type cytochrome [Candidatus Omnitrophica bacterium]|nr:c-type cytochrome [Candidatus Omnitrophota bacterium]